MQLYVFGSATHSEYPHDLDVVMLYQYNMKNAQNVRNETVQYLMDTFEIPIDCVLLSFAENEQVHFTKKENASKEQQYYISLQDTV